MRLKQEAGQAREHRNNSLSQEKGNFSPQNYILPAHLLQPQQIRELQSRLGNRAVIQMIQSRQSNSSQKQTVVQRAEEEESSWLDSATDWVADTASSVGDTVSEGARQAWDAASSGVGAVEDMAGQAWDTASSGVGAVEDMAGQAWDTASSGVGAVEDMAGDAWDTVSEGAGQAYDAVSSGVDTVGEVAGDAWDTVSGGAGQAWDYAKGGVEYIDDLTGDVWKDAKKTVKSVSGKANKGFDKILGAGKKGVKKVVGGIDDAWDTANNVYDTVSTDAKRITEDKENIWHDPLTTYGTYGGIKDLAKEHGIGSDEKFGRLEYGWGKVQQGRNTVHDLNEQRKQIINSPRYKQFKQEKKELMARRKEMTRQEYTEEVQKLIARYPDLFGGGQEQTQGQE